MNYPDGTEYSGAVQNPQHAFADSALKTSRVQTNPLGLPRISSGSFALSFFLESTNTDAWVVRCFKSERPPDRQDRYRAISAYLATTREPYFRRVEYLEHGICVNREWYPILKMPQVQGKTLQRYIEERIINKQSTADLPEKFRVLVNALNAQGVAHGDLQHGNILVSNGQLVLIDYDGMYVPALRGRSSAESGHSSYQHPERDQEFGPELDRFSSIAIYLALRAVSTEPGLWGKYSNGDNLLFGQSDFIAPNDSKVLKEIEGISGFGPLVARFRKICAGPLSGVPLLDVFLSGAADLSTAGTVQRQTHFAPRIQPVLDGNNYRLMLAHVGEKVDVVGRIEHVRSAKTVSGKPYVFFNFSGFYDGCFTVVLWSEALELFRRQDRSPETLRGKWVRIRGFLTGYQSDITGFIYPQLVIDVPSQIEELAGGGSQARQLLTGNQPVVPAQTPRVDQGAWWESEGKNPPVVGYHDVSQPTQMTNTAKSTPLQSQNPPPKNAPASSVPPAPPAQQTPTPPSHPVLRQQAPTLASTGSPNPRSTAQQARWAQLRVTPTRLYMDVTNPSTEAMHELQIANTGDAPLRGSIVTAASYIKIDPNGLDCPPGTSTRVAIRLRMDDIPKSSLGLPSTNVSGSLGGPVHELVDGAVEIHSNGGQATIPVWVVLQTPVPGPLPAPGGSFPAQAQPTQKSIWSNYSGLLILLAILAAVALVPAALSFRATSTRISGSRSSVPALSTEKPGSTALDELGQPADGAAVTSTDSPLLLPQTTAPDSLAVPCPHDIVVQLQSPRGVEVKQIVAFRWRVEGDFPKECGFRLLLSMPNQPETVAYDPRTDGSESGLLVRSNQAGQIAGKQVNATQFQLVTDLAALFPAASERTTTFKWRVEPVSIAPESQAAEILVEPAHFFWIPDDN